jgi:hypothetical protein
MYGMMRASLLFYLKLVDKLIADGFELITHMIPVYCQQDGKWKANDCMLAC